MKVKLKHFESKSRKGFYVYVNRKGAPARYYRYDEKVPIDVYLQYYNDKYLDKKDVRLGKYKKAYHTEFRGDVTSKVRFGKQMAKLTQRPRIKNVVGRGMSSVKVSDVFKLTHNNVKSLYRKLFRPLVIDNELLKLIATEENVKKLKHRLDFKVTVYGMENEVLGEAVHIGKKTLQQVVNDLKNNFKFHQRVESGSPTIAKTFERLGYQFSHSSKEGFMKKLSLVMRFRKKDE